MDRMRKLYCIADQTTPKVNEYDVSYTLNTVGGGKEITVVIIDDCEDCKSVIANETRCRND